MSEYKILIIDDSEIIFKMIHKTLHAIGFNNIDYANNGFKGIEMDKANNYDLITYDITMPDLNGIDTAKKLLENNPDKKIIMVTAIGQKNSVREVLDLGIKHYILKPFTPEKLLKTVAEILKK